MVRDNRHDSAYILGAICPSRGVGAAIWLIDDPDRIRSIGNWTVR
jgi:hypothetical protein